VAEANGHYLEVFELALGKCDLIVWDVDQEVAIACANAAVAAYDFRAFLMERCCCHIVCEGAAVAGCFVCLAW
jgi:hypothetical protein